MTTPDKQSIMQRATELYFKDNPHIQTTPEEDELKESGYFWASQTELMRTPYKQFEPLEKPQGPETPKPIVEPFSLDVDLCMKSNILVSGVNHSGKSRLSAKICSMLHKQGWQILAFDNSGVWDQISDLPYIVKVAETTDFQFPLSDRSLVLDTSDLNIDTQRMLLNGILETTWLTRLPCSPWLLIAIEESELFLKNVRGKTAQNILRTMHTGRNRKIRTLCIATDLALIDASFIRLCQLRFHGKLGIEQNSRNKFKATYGKEWLSIAEDLECGEFVSLSGDKLSLIKTDCFEPEQTPQNFIEYLHTALPKPKMGLFLSLLEHYRNLRGN